MSNFRKYMVNNITNDTIWNMLDLYFDKYYVENNMDENIPKKIHQVWLGGDLPYKYDRLVKTWLDMNPDWEYKLWTDVDVKDFGLENIEAFNNGFIIVNFRICYFTYGF